MKKLLAITGSLIIASQAMTVGSTSIDGYSGGGGYLEYVDPASGSSVPARSTMSTSTFQVMVYQRGIIS